MQRELGVETHLPNTHVYLKRIISKPKQGETVTQQNPTHFPEFSGCSLNKEAKEIGRWNEETCTAETRDKKYDQR